MPALLRAEWNLDAGLDLRLRYYATNNLPNSAYGEGASETYGRYRTRVWGSVENDWGKLYIRLGNEFRDYAYPDSKSASKRFPDVLYVDNLYLQTKAQGLELRGIHTPQDKHLLLRKARFIPAQKM